MFPVGTRGRHVYLYQAFASSEQLSARVALFHRCRLVTGAISGTSTDEWSAGVGSACFFTGAASCSGGAAGRTTNRTERLYSHRHGHGAPAPTHRDGKAGRARSGNDATAANSDTHSDGNASRDHGKPAGYDVAVQPAACISEHHHQQSDSSEPGPELRQPVLHPARRHLSRSCARRVAPGAARSRRFPRPRAGERHRLHGRLRSRPGSRGADRPAFDPEDRDLPRRRCAMVRRRSAAS